MTTAQHGGASAEALITTNTKISAIEYLRELLPSRSPSPLPSPLSPVSADTTAAADSEVAKEVKGRSPARSPFEDQPKIKYMMAQPSGVTQEGLIRSLKEKVGATHVEIEDMSGSSPIPSYLPLPTIIPSYALPFYHPATSPFPLPRHSLSFSVARG